jgi:hypothetical protein
MGFMEWGTIIHEWTDRHPGWSIWLDDGPREDERTITVESVALGHSLTTVVGREATYADVRAALADLDRFAAEHPVADP